MSEEFTEDELAVLDGKDVQEEEAPVIPEPEEPVAEEPAVEAQEEVTPEVEQLRRANKGILEELIKTRRSAKEDREWRSQIQERMDLMADRLAPQEEEEVPEVEPDRDADPLGWSVWAAKQNMEKVVAPIKEELEATKEKENVQEFNQQFMQATKSAEDQFLATQTVSKEDYESRLDALRLDRAKWYVASGMDVAAAEEAVKVDEIGFIAQCLQDGKNPAVESMRMYDAVKPAGIPSQQETPTQEAKPGGNLDKVDAVRRGQNTDALSNVPSSGDKHVITFEQFADMPDDDPIARKIMSNPKLFSTIQISGQVTV